MQGQLDKRKLLKGQPEPQISCIDARNTNSQPQLTLSLMQSGNAQ